jgi:predicted transcriptional regulator
MVHKLESRLSPIDHKIIKALLESDEYLSTKEIAKLAGEISWNTALLHLNILYHKGWIERKVIGNRQYWRGTSI